MTAQPRSRSWSAATLAMLLASGGACRLGEGEHCFCADECRGGLACVTDRGALEPGTCVTEGAQAGADPLSGVCLEQGEQMGGQAPDVRPLVPFDDSKRDLPRVGDETTLAGSSTADSDAATTTEGDESGSSGAATGAESSGGTAASSGDASSGASSGELEGSSGASSGSSGDLGDSAGSSSEG